jgi:hypothetical protein
VLTPRGHHRLASSRARRLAALLGAWLVLLPPPLAAYRKRLTQEEVTEAYYLGQRHDAQLGAFFDRYQRNLPVPRESGDYVSSVVIRTPFALAVLRSYSAIGHYTAQDAWRDYLAASNEFEVIAYLDYSYGNNSAPATEPPVARDSVRGYYVQVKQWRDNEEHTLVAQDSHFERDIIGLLGGDTMPAAIPLHATFRVQDIESSDLTVEVTIPSGRRVVVTYNLQDLR